MNTRIAAALKDAVEDEKRELVLVAEEIYQRAQHVHTQMVSLGRIVDAYKERRTALKEGAALAGIDISILNLHALTQYQQKISSLHAYIWEDGGYRYIPTIHFD